MHRVLVRSLLALALAATPVAAQLPTGTPADFAATSRSTFRSCDTVAGTDPFTGRPYGVGQCLHATVYVGRSTLTGQWGMSAEWFATLLGEPTERATVDGWVSGLAFSAMDFGTRDPDAWHFGTWGLPTAHPLPSTVFGYSSYLTAASLPTEIYFMRDFTYPDPSTASGLWYDDRWGSLELVSHSVVPEPASVILVASGLLVLGGVRLRRRR